MEPLRLDVLLHRLCLTRSRSEAKSACDANAVLLNGRPGRPSDLIAVGTQILIHYARRQLEIELLGLPGKNTSRAAARDLYRTLHDEREPAW